MYARRLARLAVDGQACGTPASALLKTPDRIARRRIQDVVHHEGLVEQLFLLLLLRRVVRARAEVVGRIQPLRKAVRVGSAASASPSTVGPWTGRRLLRLVLEQLVEHDLERADAPLVAGRGRRELACVREQVLPHLVAAGEQAVDRGGTAAAEPLVEVVVANGIGVTEDRRPWDLGIR
jgi:hypothetical protein